MNLVKVDDYTVRMEFSVAYYAILANLSSVSFSGCQSDAFEASKYLKQFHKTYNAKVDDDAKAAGFTTWVQYFAAKRYNWTAAKVGVPSMGHGALPRSSLKAACSSATRTITRWTLRATNFRTSTPSRPLSSLTPRHLR